METEDTAKDFAKTHATLVKSKTYFRFSVRQGLQDIKLDDMIEISHIHSSSRSYMDDGEANIKATECALNLSLKRSE